MFNTDSDNILWIVIIAAVVLYFCCFKDKEECGCPCPPPPHCC